MVDCKRPLKVGTGYRSSRIKHLSFVANGFYFPTSPMGMDSRTANVQIEAIAVQETVVRGRGYFRMMVIVVQDIT